MLIALIRSVPHAKVESLLITEDGLYELEVHVDLVEARASGDAPGFVRKTIAQHLAQCVSTTKLPLGESLWQVAFTKWAQTNFNYPEGFVI